MSEKSATRLIVGTKENPVLFSYCHVWHKHSMDNDDSKAKYSVAVLINKDDTKMIKRVEAAIEAAVEQGVAAKWKGKRPGNLKLPLRDGDVERPDDPAYENKIFFNAASTTQPQIVSEDHNDPILDQTEFYSGCFGRVSVNFYPYDVNSKGVAAGLGNLQKLADGERLSGEVSAADDFGDEEDDLLN